MGKLVHERLANYKTKIIEWFIVTLIKIAMIIYIILLVIFILYSEINAKNL